MHDRSASALAGDRAEAMRLIPVSRETAARLDRFVELLLNEQARINLISDASRNKVWTRHVADSLQLLRLAPDAKVWVDLGSGAGFPGLVLACALAEREAAEVHLVESTLKKANFLRFAAGKIGVPAVVHVTRIEDFTRTFRRGADVVTARALAPLDKLLALAAPFLEKGAQGLFLKGQDIERELTEASKYWIFDPTFVPSLTDPRGRVVLVRSIARRVRQR